RLVERGAAPAPVNRAARARTKRAETVPLAIRIKPLAHKQIADFDWSELREAGLWLAGYTTSSEVVIEFAVPGTYEYGFGLRDTVTLLREIAVEKIEEGSRFDLVGAMHSHPDGPLEWSQTDHDSAVRTAKELGRPFVEMLHVSDQVFNWKRNVTA